MKHFAGETASVPEQEVPSQENPGRWLRVRRRLGLVSSTSQREDSVATTDFEAVDPLGGFFHPDWEEHKRQEAARANRFILRRTFARFVEWMKSDEPNLTTGDTRLDATPEEMRNRRPLSPQQQSDKDTSLAVFEGVGPSGTDFYDDLLSSKPHSELPQNQQK